MERAPYLVIARKYRPQTFDEVIGQDHVVTTLKNAISLGRVGHAYLFAGARGVGKTSMARIFAKALNCKDGPTLRPCGRCESCRGIENSRSLDVLEIDGASNRGIEEIRSLRENVKFAPALGKFKIYIIDEVHQITPDGFNALLKTLEEPPSHAKFVFATTASQKVPATILSRCQRFDFRRIPTAVIAEALARICKEEKIKIKEEALFAIAKAADGSLRDGQSILDQIAAAAKGEIEKNDVIRSLGVIQEEKLTELVDAIAVQDAKSALHILDDVLKEGKDPALFLEKLLEHTRNLLFVRISDGLGDLVDAGEPYRKELLRQKDHFTKEDLFYFFSVIVHALGIVKRFETKRVPLEMAVIKLAHRVPMVEISRVLEELKEPEKKTEKAEPATIEDSPDSQEIEELPTGDLQIQAERLAAPLEKVWPLLLRALKAEKISVASYLAEGRPLGLENKVARISFPERLAFHRESLETEENRSLIEKHLSGLLDEDVRVAFQSVKEEVSGPSGPAGSGESPSQAVKSAMNLFGGRIVRS